VLYRLNFRVIGLIGGKYTAPLQPMGSKNLRLKLAKKGDPARAKFGRDPHVSESVHWMEKGQKADSLSFVYPENTARFIAPHFDHERCMGLTCDIVRHFAAEWSQANLA